MGLIKLVNNWTQVPNTWLKDKRLSYKGLGILCKLQSLPDNWDFSVKGVAAIMNDGVDSVRSGVQELEELGYLTREDRKRDNDGHFKGGDWYLHEHPFDKENPMSENPAQVFPTQYKNERIQELNNVPMGGEKPTVVRVEKWDFDSKGNWKRKRTVYTTVDEADKIEAAEREEYITFGFWPSPPLVGQADKMKTMTEKKTKLRPEYPDDLGTTNEKLKTFVKITDM